MSITLTCIAPLWDSRLIERKDKNGPNSNWFVIRTEVVIAVDVSYHGILAFYSPEHTNNIKAGELHLLILKIFPWKDTIKGIPYDDLDEFDPKFVGEIVSVSYCDTPDPLPPILHAVGTGKPIADSDRSFVLSANQYTYLEGPNTPSSIVLTFPMNKRWVNFKVPNGSTVITVSRPNLLHVDALPDHSIFSAFVLEFSYVGRPEGFATEKVEAPVTPKKLGYNWAAHKALKSPSSTKSNSVMQSPPVTPTKNPNAADSSAPSTSGVQTRKRAAATDLPTEPASKKVKSAIKKGKGKARAMPDADTEESEI